MKMRLSHFGFISQIDQIAAAGYDCAELRIDEIMTFDEAQYLAALQKVRSCGLGTEVHVNPIPMNVVISDPKFDLTYYREYLKKVMDRSARMGARYIVFGNSKARKIPDGPGCEAAIHKNEELVMIMCENAAKYNITILLEPLGKAITNSVLSVPEAYRYAKKLGCLNLKSMIDYRWLIEERPDLNDFIDYSDFIKHVHIDNPWTTFPERRVPTQNDGYDYTPLFDMLKKICYGGILSIEANTFTDFSADLKSALDLFAHYEIYPYRTKD